MKPRRVQIGSTGETVRANIANARKEQRLTLRHLSDRLARTERPLAHNTLSEIERGARRIDVDDLVAIADALGLSPASLLPPAGRSITQARWETCPVCGALVGDADAHLDFAHRRAR